MKINAEDFRTREADKVDLGKWPTNVDPVYKSKKHYKGCWKTTSKAERPAAASLRIQSLFRSVLFDTTVRQDRYRLIPDLEAHLHRNGTRAVKFYLNLSKDEQRKCFLDRIDEPERTGNLAMRTSRNGNSGSTI